MTGHDAADMRRRGAAAIARVFMGLMGPVLLLLSAYGLWRAFGGDWQQYMWPAVGLGAGLPWTFLGFLGGRFARDNDDKAIDRFCNWMIGGVMLGMVWLVVTGFAAIVLKAIF